MGNTINPTPMINPSGFIDKEGIISPFSNRKIARVEPQDGQGMLKMLCIGQMSGKSEEEDFMMPAKPSHTYPARHSRKKTG